MAKSFREFLSDESGGGTVWSLLWFMVLVAICGLAVDSTNGYRVQTMMQATADASAHAAVQSLPDETDAVITALDYVEYNMASADYGTLLSVDEVDIGTWAPATRTFIDGNTPANAVRVTLRSTAATGNPVPVNFLRIIGLMEWNITVQAIAAVGVLGNCLYGGFLSYGKVYSGSTNDYVDKLCIHGDLGVKVGSTNYFEDGVTVTMADSLDLLEASQDNEGLEAALGVDDDMYLPLVGQVSSIVEGLKGVTYVPPGFIVEQKVILGPGEYIKDVTLVPGTLYVSHEVVDFGSGSSGAPLQISDIAVVSTQEIKTGSFVELSNVLIATTGKVTLGSENQIGTDAYCNSGKGAVHIFAGGEYSAGSQSTYSGVQLVGEGIVKLGSELTSMKGINVQAGGDIFWGSAELYGGCAPPDLYNPIQAGVTGVAIVQ